MRSVGSALGFAQSVGIEIPQIACGEEGGLHVLGGFYARRAEGLGREPHKPLIEVINRGNAGWVSGRYQCRFGAVKTRARDSNTGACEKRQQARASASTTKASMPRRSLPTEKSGSNKAAGPSACFRRSTP